MEKIIKIIKKIWKGSKTLDKVMVFVALLNLLVGNFSTFILMSIIFYLIKKDLINKSIEDENQI